MNSRPATTPIRDPIPEVSTKDKIGLESPNKVNSETFKKFSITVPSKHKPRTSKQTQFNACNTGVYPIRTHGVGLWGNKRVVMSVRVDEKIKREGTEVLQLLYGSTCRGIESFLTLLIAAYKQQKLKGVYPSNTIEIGKLVIERNLRPRRKLVVPKEEIEETTEIRRVKKTKRRLVLDDLPDYSQYSLEKLDKLHRMYQNLGDVGKSALVFTELKRRGVVQ
jgi:hypothetical protein